MVDVSAEVAVQGVQKAMRAACVQAPGVIGIADVSVPEPGPGQVRIRIEGSGVCASNLSPWEGQPWFQYPFEPGALGHEGWGWVDAVGHGVREIEPGARVAALSNNAYAEYDLAAVDQIVALPRALDGLPFPGEPLGCAFNVFARSRIRAESTVAVVGAGFLGCLLSRLAANAGARVIALSRRGFALEMARGFGASSTITMDDHYRVIDDVRRLTDGRFCDCVIECTGKQWPLDLAAEITAERGTLTIAGYHQDGPRQVNMQMWNWRGIDVVNAHERDPAVYLAGMRAAVAAVAGGAVDPTPLYTHTFPLERLDEALNATVSSRLW
jgi:threonine dehydrogenase-like Zn-dependent dehydrogenase